MDKLKEEFEAFCKNYNLNYGFKLSGLGYSGTETQKAFLIYKFKDKELKDELKEIKKLKDTNEYSKDVLKEITKFQYETDSKDALILSGWAEQALERIDA